MITVLSEIVLTCDEHQRGQITILHSRSFFTFHTSISHGRNVSQLAMGTGYRPWIVGDFEDNCDYLEGTPAP